MATRQELIEQANAQHSAHAQYEGHWDAWVVATAKRQIKVRGSAVVEKGEAVLMDPASVHTCDDPLAHKSAQGKVWATFYLARSLSGCNTSLRADYFDGAF
jgi:hypothetical protein